MRFFHNFQKKRRNSFTIFKRNDAIFNNWSGTGPLHNFGKKTLPYLDPCCFAIADVGSLTIKCLKNNVGSSKCIKQKQVYFLIKH